MSEIVSETDIFVCASLIKSNLIFYLSFHKYSLPSHHRTPTFVKRLLENFITGGEAGVFDLVIHVKIEGLHLSIDIECTGPVHHNLIALRGDSRWDHILGG